MGFDLMYAKRAFVHWYGVRVWKRESSRKPGKTWLLWRRIVRRSAWIRLMLKMRMVTNIENLFKPFVLSKCCKNFFVNCFQYRNCVLRYTVAILVDCEIITNELTNMIGHINRL